METLITRNKRGQRLGTKGERTRQRIMDGLVGILQSKHLWEISVAEICGKCGIAPTNFYTYFNGVEDVMLAVATDVSEGWPRIERYLDGNWSGRRGVMQARRLVEEAIAYWREHHAVLNVINLMADDRHPAFSRLRVLRLRPVHKAMEATIRQAQQEGRLSKRLHARMASFSAASIVEGVSARYELTLSGGITHKQLVDVVARQLVLLLDGAVA